MRFSFCAPLSVGAPNPGRPQKVSHCWKCCLWSSSSACLRFWVWSFLGCRTRFGHSNTFYSHYFFTIYCVPSLKYCNGVELPLDIIVSIKSVGKGEKCVFATPPGVHLTHQRWQVLLGLWQRGIGLLVPESQMKCQLSQVFSCWSRVFFFKKKNILSSRMHLTTVYFFPVCLFKAGKVVW